ncbi:hypothetical protein EW093_07495 [Thiospirochaeta perfilievii]|uniref:Right handed beta helix domain-containing protein n=1 Tax=Thiospirochaeta perfilievii TaxID=252967 RepID=A0A5C1QAL7_9SPIO|nr:hypothetical protein [Thiospirochaeta perfilievii]QEN04551.1 hypothetical protein EW093_07495 [Thiospirochaeta perfilievii]
MLKNVLLLFVSFIFIFSCEIGDNPVEDNSLSTTTENDTQTENGESDEENQESTTTLPTITKVGTITSDETWEEGNIYIISRDLDVEAILTIEPGVIIKIGRDVTFRTSETGKIIADGTSDKRITFTSTYSDLGGDTDGHSYDQYKGVWEDISIDTTDNLFNYCTFEYADEAIKQSSNSDPYKITITNSIFRENNTGISIKYNTSTESVVDNNRLYSNTYPMMLDGTFDIGNTNTFTKEDGITTNQYQRISLYSFGTITIDRSVSFSETEVPYYTIAPTEINNNAILTIANGAKFVVGSGTTIYIETGSDLIITDGGAITISMDTNYDGTSVIDSSYYWKGIKNGTSSSSPYRENVTGAYYSENSSI